MQLWLYSTPNLRKSQHLSQNQTKSKVRNIPLDEAGAKADAAPISDAKIASFMVFNLVVDEYEKEEGYKEVSNVGLKRNVG